MYTCFVLCTQASSLMAVGEDYEAADALEDIAEMIDVVLATNSIGSSLMSSFPQIMELSQWMREAMTFVKKLENGGMADLLM